MSDTDRPFLSALMGKDRVRTETETYDVRKSIVVVTPTSVTLYEQDGILQVSMLHITGENIKVDDWWGWGCG